jgi:diaminohydroxyphosphoribosylaminopyrimidine deaminase/5-amino-6-(5-phosphoribosylamino)uracil reductase
MTAPATQRDDSAWMRLAIDLAAQSLYLTSPNPRVGCVIVRDNRILGRGATQMAGGPHAEVMALRDMRAQGGSARGATVYVTLEPCSHHGRTPPCVDALIAARPARVVVALRDPNPLVAGRGIQRLLDAGIEVTEAVCAQDALAVNPGFFARMTRKTPWVWLKTAVSLDGHPALNNGASQWITGPDARADGHHWRARSCVVLTGLGTVLADDPLLTVRGVQTPRQPVRAVVDSRFAIPETARIFDGGPVWVFTARRDTAKEERLERRNVTVIPVPVRQWAGDNHGDAHACRDHIDLAAMLAWMGRHDVNEVHVEAGPGLAGALLRADCVDELLVYMAPLLLGQGRPMAELSELQSLEQARRFSFFDTAPVGNDVRLRARHPGRWQALKEAALTVAGS